MGGSASREKFRTSVIALIEEDVSPDDADFWDALWKIPSSMEDVFKLISPNDARKLRDERFDNLATLFTQATAQLCQIVDTPYNIYFNQALNCVRVLTRMLPFLLEKGDLGDADPNVEHLCWGTGNDNQDNDNAIRAPDDPMIGKMIGGGDDELSEDQLIKAENSTSYNEDYQEPLALLVVHAAMHMLFLPQFTCEFYEGNEEEDSPYGDSYTVATKATQKGTLYFKKGDMEDETDDQLEMKRLEDEAQAKEDTFMMAEVGLGVTKLVGSGVVLLPKPTSIIWAAGCGVTLKQLGYEGGTRKFDKNRVEVLRLLLAACCDPLFSPADEYNPLASRWLAVCVAADAPNIIGLFYSLMNTILSYDPNGMGVPYSSTFASDTHVKLVELSSQVFCVLLDCGLSGSPQPVKNDFDEPIVEFEDVSKGGFNMFRTLLARMDKEKDLNFIYKGVSRLLKNVYESKNTYLPNSTKCLQCFQEILIFFWKLLEENPVFMSHILTQCDVTEIIVPICFLMYQSRNDPTQIGLIHLCTFVLLKFSGERSFGVNLNKPFRTRLPCDIPVFSGGHADLICITLHKLVANGSVKLVPLYSCFITVLCNVSPYWRSISLFAAVKLVNLFELFSSPKFLYSKEHSYRHLALLLEIFNNVVQYQFHGNPHLVYAIIRRKDSFGGLVSLTLPKVISQYQKVYGEKHLVQYDADAGEKCRHVPSLENDDSNRDEPKDVPQEDTVPKEDKESISEHSTQDDTTTGCDHFEPTEEWLSKMKQSLPLETITRFLQHLVPIVDEIVERKKGLVDEIEIIEVLKEVTLVGLLPVPHAIVVRTYQPNQYTSLWFTTFLWSVIFLRNQSLPIFDGDAIELFQVSETQEDKNESKIS